MSVSVDIKPRHSFADALKKNTKNTHLWIVPVEWLNGSNYTNRKLPQCDIILTGLHEKGGGHWIWFCNENSQRVEPQPVGTKVKNKSTSLTVLVRYSELTHVFQPMISLYEGY